VLYKENEIKIKSLNTLLTGLNIPPQMYIFYCTLKKKVNNINDSEITRELMRVCEGDVIPSQSSL
jgi:hypothetical protein